MHMNVVRVVSGFGEHWQPDTSSRGALYSFRARGGNTDRTTGLAARMPDIAYGKGGISSDTAHFFYGLRPV